MRQHARKRDTRAPLDHTAARLIIVNHTHDISPYDAIWIDDPFSKAAPTNERKYLRKAQRCEIAIMQDANRLLRFCMHAQYDCPDIHMRYFFWDAPMRTQHARPRRAAELEANPAPGSAASSATYY